MLSVRVVSPEEELFSGDAEFVRTKTVEGDIGILSGHAPILAQLVSCETKIRTAEGEERLFDIDGGFISVKDDKVIVLTAEEIEPGHALTAPEIEPEQTASENTSSES